MYAYSYIHDTHNLCNICLNLYFHTDVVSKVSAYLLQYTCYSSHITRYISCRFLVSYSLFGANNEPSCCLVYSRKHFSEKEAEIWWEENQRRVYSKYNIKSFVTPSTGKIDH